MTSQCAYAATAPTLYLYPTASNPLSTSIILNGNITDDGGASTTVRGFNYGTTASYGSASSTTGTYGVGAYTVMLTGLTCSTMYHFQAFTTNSAGTGTSTDQTFTTFTCPNAATYYVDSINGNDSNSGLNPNIAMKTLAGLASKYTLTGTNILLAKNSVFREIFTVPNNSYVGAYGSGTNPIISGADLLNNASFTLTSGKTYTYQISLPYIPCTFNSDANRTDCNVLIVWENNVRLGGAFRNNQTSISGVESHAGSYWWDSTNKILYIHPADSSNPTTNGKTYEASTRTLAIHGGDGFIVEDIIAEKDYAATSGGQQGYGILGYGSGTYRRCVGRYNWNHNIGVANEVAAGTLVFNHCTANDVEDGIGGTNFVAYKNGLSSAATVIVSNSLSQQLTYDSLDTSSYGFITHGNSVNAVFDNIQSNRNTYGFELLHDAASISTVTLTGSNNIFTNCSEGIITYDPGTLYINNVTTNNCEPISLSAIGDVTINNIKAINSFRGVVGSQPATSTVTVNNSIIANSSAPAAYNSSYGVQMSSYGSLVVNNVSFYNVGTPLMMNFTASDYNNFFGYVRLASETTFSPGYFFDLGSWRSASGMDAHSTTNNPGYTAEFFNVSVTDPSISGGDHAPAFLSELTPVATPSSSTTPIYTFYSTESGTISYGGDCSSNTTSATNGSNTVQFNTLSVGVHSNCTITVTDSAGNASNPLSVSTFVITDITPPSVSMTLPASGSTVAGSAVSLSASSTDDVGVVGVQFMLDGSTNINAEVTSTSSLNTYTTTWNSASVSNGSHTLSSVARDASGNYATSTVAVTVSNVVTPTPTYSSSGGGGTLSPAQLAALLAPSASTTAYINSLATPTATPNCQTTASTATSFTRSLTLGSTGSDVKALQAFLNSHGFTVSAYGNGSSGHETTYYGPATASAVSRFQNAYATLILTPSGLTHGTGYFGPATMKEANLLSTSTSSRVCLTPTALITPPVSTAYSFSSDLTLGSTGSDVKALQVFLNSHPSTSSGQADFPFRVAITGPGSPGHETIYFGLATKAALVNFQKANGINPATGYFGVITRTAIEAAI